jgi:hypothetical protein
MRYLICEVGLAMCHSTGSIGDTPIGPFYFSNANYPYLVHHYCSNIVNANCQQSIPNLMPMRAINSPLTNSMLFHTVVLAKTSEK